MASLRRCLLLVLAVASSSAAAEAPTALTVQELQGRLADAETRAAFEAGERERLTRELEELRAQASASAEEVERQRGRAGELDRLRTACEEREDRLRADLDLCARTRQQTEEQKARCSKELTNIASTHSAELLGKDRDLEECRGRVADLEAQNVLLAAEKQGAARESREKVDEIARTYDDLVTSLKKDLGDCQGKVSAGEKSARALEEEASELLRGLQQTFRQETEKGRVTLSAAGARVEVKMSLNGLYAAKAGEWSSAGRKAIKGLAEAVKSVKERAVVVEDLSPGIGAVANAVRLAAALEKEGGLNPGFVAVVAPSARTRGETSGASTVLVRILPHAVFESVFSPSPNPPAK